MKKNKAFFQITNAIYSGDFATAEKELEERYHDVEYSDDPDGFNKMNQYHLYYEKQGLYDKEMDTVLEYLKAMDYPNTPDTDLTQSTAVKIASEIIDKVSPSKKAEAINLIGQDAIDSAAKTEGESN